MPLSCNLTISLQHLPLTVRDRALFGREAEADEGDALLREGEGRGVVLLADLRDRVRGSVVELELNEVDVRRRLDRHVHAAVRRLHLAVDAQ